MLGWTWLGPTTDQAAVYPDSSPATRASGMVLSVRVAVPLEQLAVRWSELPEQLELGPLTSAI